MRRAILEVAGATANTYTVAPQHAQRLMPTSNTRRGAPIEWHSIDPAANSAKLLSITDAGSLMQMEMVHAITGDTVVRPASGVPRRRR